MKIFKKSLSLALAVVMLFSSLSLTFAQNATGTGGSINKPRIEKQKNQAVSKYQLAVWEYFKATRFMKDFIVGYRTAKTKFMRFVNAAPEAQEEYKVEAKDFLILHVDHGIKRLKTTKKELEIIELSEVPIDFDFGLSKEKIDGEIEILEGIKTELENLGEDFTPDQVIEIAEKIKDEWKNVKGIIYEGFTLFVTTSIANIEYATGERRDHAAERIEQEKNEGKDVSYAEELLGDLDEKLDEASTSLENAIDIFLNIDDDTEGKLEELKKGHAELKTTHAALKQARKIYRNIRVELLGLYSAE